MPLFSPDFQVMSKITKKGLYGKTPLFSSDFERSSRQNLGYWGMHPPKSAPERIILFIEQTLGLFFFASYSK